MITVGQLAPAGCWDTTMLDLLFTNRLWHTGLQFRQIDGYPTTDGCVLIIPGRYWFTRCNDISEALSRYRWVLAIRTGDEEDLFDPDNIVHPNIRWWVQTPRPDKDYGDARLFGVGYTPAFITPTPQDRDVDVFLSAQNTHQRRHDCFGMIRMSPGRKVVKQTDGFTQGMDPTDYSRMMCAAKIAPAPSGPASPDSFRLYEALQAHTVPIADDITPGYPGAGYWRTVFPDAPFPILTDYADLPGYVGDQLELWPANANRITAWWMRQKRQMALNLIDDLTDLGAL